MTEEQWKLKFARSANRRKLTMYLRTKIWQFFEHGLHPKSSQILLGCSREHFLRHIKSLMREGMTMENYGPVWHLDHVVACKHFDLADSEQRLRCFHWTNYQPLFARENKVKSGKMVSVGLGFSLSTPVGGGLSP